MRANRILLGLIFFLLISSLYSQESDSAAVFGSEKGMHKAGNMPGFDEQEIRLGFSILTNYSTYSFTKSILVSQNDSVDANANGRMGFSLSINVLYAISQRFQLRILPTISFEERELVYNVNGKSNNFYAVMLKNESTWIAAPVHVKFCTKRFADLRGYILGGGFYAFNIEKDKKPITTGLYNFSTAKKDHGYSFGAGMDFYMKYFKMGFEVRYNAGIVNILEQTNGFFTSPLQSVKTRSWVVGLTFEG